MLPAAMIHTYVSARGTAGVPDIHTTKQNWVTFHTIPTMMSRFKFVKLEVMEDLGEDLYWEDFGEFIHSLLSILDCITNPLCLLAKEEEEARLQDRRKGKQWAKGKYPHRWVTLS